MKLKHSLLVLGLNALSALGALAQDVNSVKASLLTWCDNNPNAQLHVESSDGKIKNDVYYWADAAGERDFLIDSKSSIGPRLLRIFVLKRTDSNNTTAVFPITENRIVFNSTTETDIGGLNLIPGHKASFQAFFTQAGSFAIGSDTDGNFLKGVLPASAMKVSAAKNNIDETKITQAEKDAIEDGFETEVKLYYDNTNKITRLKVSSAVVSLDQTVTYQTFDKTTVLANKPNVSMGTVVNKNFMECLAAELRLTPQSNL